jgi:hypothetical protein
VRKHVVAAALARQQSGLVLESAAIRNLLPMFASLWLQAESYLVENGGYWQAEQVLWMGLAKQDSF